MALKAIKYQPGQLEILDQRLLPSEVKYIQLHGVEDGWRAIHKMQVRGAPAIAIVGCLSLAVELYPEVFTDKKVLRQEVEGKLNYMVSARPTAVNMKLAADHLLILVNALDKDETINAAEMKSKLLGAIRHEQNLTIGFVLTPELQDHCFQLDTERSPIRFLAEIEAMLERDIADNHAIGDAGAQALMAHCPGDGLLRVLTHCNTGSLATAGYGTALGVIRSLNSQRKLEQVYATETRPFNQGARLTAFELVHEKIPATLICDSMVAALMRTQSISAVVVGADRVAANGDTANKIGTYQIAVVAKHHGVPFYVAAPRTSIDFNMLSGKYIVIEERPESEMTCVGGVRIAAQGVGCWNPAFDVTPAELITAIITEKGVFKPDQLEILKET